MARLSLAIGGLRPFNTATIAMRAFGPIVGFTATIAIDAFGEFVDVSTLSLVFVAFLFGEERPAATIATPGRHSYHPPFIKYWAYSNTIQYFLQAVAQ